MSAVLTAQEPSAKYLVNLQPPLVRHFDLIAQAPGGVARLRELILTLAVQGKLVPQDPSDEPASVLLQNIRTEKDRLIAEGKIKRDKPLAEIADQEKPFELPQGWAWTSLSTLGTVGSSSRVHQKDWTSNGVPFYRAREIVSLSKNGYVHNELFITEEHFQKLAKSGVCPEEGDVMITGVGTIGIPYVVRASDRFYFKDASVLIFKNHYKLSPTYLDMFFRTPYWIDRIHAESMGTTVHTLTIARASDVLVPLPPAKEQSRIVTRVEELMQLCDALEASGQLEAQQHAQLVSTLLGTLTQSETPDALADNWQRIATHFDVLLDRPEAVDALEQTILQLAVRGLLVPQDPTDEPASALLQRVSHLNVANLGKKKKLADDELPLIPYALPEGWAWAQLGELVENMGSGWSPACDEGERSESTQWAVLRTTAVQVNEFRSREHKVIPSKLSPRPEIEVKDGDILITRAGPMNRVGISCWVDSTPPRLMLSDKIVRFHSVADEMLPAFIVLTLNAGWTKEQIEAAKSGMAASQVNISQADLRGFWVPVCSKAEQSRIVTRVNEIRVLCADLRQRLSAGQAVQSHLANALVTG
ncbi:restriction endonuclease subunit S [Limnohabitans sp.]|uniref:restriction endonuclease subunit S n=1 Tax=Limnohabitans sp. TaxID=1907725 RepID=UPI00289C5CE3|nr:restriction endonuclease subunit S [Limnohabitans sp.]